MTRLSKVSLIATVKDERPAVESWLAGINNQTLLPDEAVIVDGGSTDGTLEILTAWAPGFPVKVLSAPGTSISQGRNLAMEHATGDIFAITDCGTVARPDWLERLTAPFQDACVDVVSGFFVPTQATRWERSLAAATLPDADELSPDRFLPSSRSVAVRARWFSQGFRYPAWLDYCEDLIWDMQLKNAGARFQTERDAVVEFRVRPNARSFWRQYFLYARGDGKAGLFGRRHIVRYAAYLSLAAVLIRKRPSELMVTACLGLIYLSRPIRRLVRRDRLNGVAVVETMAAATYVPVQVAIGDAAKMAGYPVGLRWRVRTFGSLNPYKNWRRITPSGRMWNPATPLEAPRRRGD